MAITFTFIFVDGCAYSIKDIDVSQVESNWQGNVPRLIRPAYRVATKWASKRKR
jgi:hypothetical protein